MANQPGRHACTARVTGLMLKKIELHAGLRSLRALQIKGAGNFGEQQSDTLNALLQCVTTLHLRGQSMLCHDIASPALTHITVIFPAMQALPGAADRPESLLLLKHQVYNTPACHANSCISCVATA